jgi:hypothetical protein
MDSSYLSHAWRNGLGEHEHAARRVPHQDIWFLRIGIRHIREPEEADAQKAQVTMLSRPIATHV